MCWCELLTKLNGQGLFCVLTMYGDLARKHFPTARDQWESLKCDRSTDSVVQDSGIECFKFYLYHLLAIYSR